MASRVDELSPEMVYGIDARPGSLGSRNLIATILVNQVNLRSDLLNHGTLGRQAVIWMVTLAGRSQIVQRVAYDLPRLLTSWFQGMDGTVERTILTNFIPPYSRDNSVTEARLMFRSEIGGA